MKAKRYLAIDPSGSGTTGVFFYDKESQKEEFLSFKSKHWKDHFIFIKNLCEEKEVDCIIYETTNFIKIRGYDLTSLFKIFGLIESLQYFLPIKKCEVVLVGEIKLLSKKVKEGTIKINELLWKAGRGGGWFYKQKKLEVHQLDAFLTFYCHQKRISELQLLTEKIT